LASFPIAFHPQVLDARDPEFEQGGEDQVDVSLVDCHAGMDDGRVGESRLM
jgi:hypothetical protein